VQLNMNHDGILDITMAGLEAGFKVIHIAASPLQTCDADDNLAQVLSDPKVSDFDQIPAKTNGRVVGVLERTSPVSEGTVRAYMRPLDDSILVSAEEPLPKFLSTLERTPYRLVVKGTQIEGIVTLSDVPKLPVRLMGFTLVAYLEMIMAELIRTRCAADEIWLGLLDPNRVKVLRNRLERRVRENLHLSLLEVTDFKDKISVVVKSCGLDENSARQLSQIRDLRNSIAHSRDVAHGEHGVRAFLEQLRLTEKWIETLTSFVRESLRNVNGLRAAIPPSEVLNLKG
jgi:hypothetical protein